jgi:hypothetical protein
MLLSLSASLFSFVIFFIVTLVAEYDLLWQYGYYQSYTCSIIYFGEMPAFFLSIGIILNANKWIYFLLKIKAFVRVETISAIRRLPSTNDFDEYRSSSALKNEDCTSLVDTTRTRSTTSSLATREIKFATRVNIMNGFTLLLIFIYAVIFIVKTSQGCASNNFSDGVPLMSKLFTWLFNILGVVFLGTGMIMIFTVKSHFPTFFEEFGRLLWIATLLLTLPLFIRGINSYYFGKNGGYKTWYLNNYALVNSFYVTFSTILPILT